MTIQYEISNLGTVIFEGRKYYLQDDADFTNRLLPGRVNYHEISNGEEYDFEMSATVKDSEGNDYTMYWIFTNIKGEDGRELDSFDYDNVHRVIAK